MECADFLEARAYLWKMPMKATLTNSYGLQLTGRSIDHVAPYKGKHRLHPQALKAFLDLQRMALDDGLKLELISSFRDYERQLLIWNRKARGEVTLLDVHSNPLEYSTLSSDQIIDSILRWSALPGASRHHWGTDIDVFEATNVMPEQVRLVPDEYSPGGPFYELHRWLDEKIIAGDALGFYRPYVNDLGGTSPESWHLSYAPLAQNFYTDFTLDLFIENIQAAQNLELSNLLLARAEELYDKYFRSINLP